jgi:hypothetical protein
MPGRGRYENETAPPEAGEALPSEAASTRQQAIGAAAPPASEPLQAAALNNLQKALARNFDTLSDGQAPLPEAPPYQGQVEQIPAELYAPVVAIAGFLQQSGLEEAGRHQFEPAELVATNDGVIDLAGKINAITKDTALMKAIQRGAAQAGAQPEEAPPKEAAGPKPTREDRMRELA